jgi:hypothetical protein
MTKAEMGLIKLGVSIVCGIWQAYVISILWSWFITPQWQIPAPRVIILMGILMIKSLVFVKPAEFRSSKKETDEEWFEDAGNMFLLPLMSLLIGWIFLWFV